jgi:hypothetical protein
MTLSFLLSMLCVEDQHAYFSASLFNEDTATFFELLMEALKLISGAILVCFLQSNSAFDDIKLLIYRRKAIVSLGICGLAVLGAITLFLYRLRKNIMKESMMISEKNSSVASFYEILILTASALASWIASYILNLPMFLAIFSAVGGIALSEYYLGRQVHASSSLLRSSILVLTASAATALDLRGFFNQTLSSLMLEMTWMQDISIQSLCMVVSLLGSATIIVPAVGHYSRLEVGKMEELLPSSPSQKIGVGFNRVHIGKYTLPTNSFEVLFQFVAMVITAIELLIREQVSQLSLCSLT